jgi:predicted flap endonuclease-1-like 5' DNA nuclease
VAADAVAKAETPEPAQALKEDEDAPPAPPQPMARPDQHDDLRLIRGIDAALSEKLHAIGVTRFGEIAKWGPEQIAWVFEKLGAPASPEHWPAQARLLAAGVLTDYARLVLSGEQPEPADDDDLAAWLETLPQPAAPGAGDGFYAGSRPTGFSEPPLGETDDLTRLSGVDAETAARLNGLGVWTVRQIACWSQENARWIGAYLATPGAPEREDWIGQARALTHDLTRPLATPSQPV